MTLTLIIVLALAVGVLAFIFFRIPKKGGKEIPAFPKPQQPNSDIYELRELRAMLARLKEINEEHREVSYNALRELKRIPPRDR